MNNSQRGSRFRKLVQDAFTAAGWTTTFRPHREKGDDITAVTGDYRLSVECKDHARITLAEFVDQATGNAPEGSVPVVVVKRRRRGVGEAYAVLPLAWLLRLLSDWPSVHRIAERAETKPQQCGCCGCSCPAGTIDGLCLNCSRGRR